MKTKEKIEHQYKNKISVGSDPEFFLEDSQGNLKSAIGIVDGTKLERFDLGGGHKCYYDNVLAECEVKPAKSADQFVDSIRDCLQRLTAYIKPHRIKMMASTMFPATECNHPEAWRFGCSPEFCAYDIRVIEPLVCEKGNSFRSAGGHIHIGFAGGEESTSENQELQFAITMNRIWVIRMCDVFIGLPSLFMDTDPTSQARRKLYGGAGTHRPCHYGVEYRTLSNFWLVRPSLVHLMYQLAEFVVSVVMEQKNHESIWEKSIEPEKLRSVINSGDGKMGKEYFQQVKSLMPSVLVEAIEKESQQETGNIYENWSLS